MLPSHIEKQIAAFSDEQQFYAEEGYLGPFDFSDPESVQMLARLCSAGIPTSFLPDSLARHAAVRKMAELAGHPSFIKKISPILGNDILLWGSQIIRQKPEKKKRFHVDAEFVGINGVSIWLAVKNVVPQSTFFLISRSHLIGISPQELEETQKINLQNSAEVLDAARQFNPGCELIKVDMKDGQFILFDGRIWHGTANATSEERIAMNFRYTTPDQLVRISRDGKLPNPNWRRRKPSCLVVVGKDAYKVNRTIDKRQISLFRSFLVGCVYYFPRHALQKAAIYARSYFVRPRRRQKA